MCASLDNTTQREIRNSRASLMTDMFGGAIVNFHLHDEGTNPLSFRFTKEQMPDNNKNGAAYQGHFLCLGRWGEPSAGEKKAAMPDHGHFANMEWRCSAHTDRTINMEASSALEGLQVQRTIELHNTLSLYKVSETVTNINTLGRMYNMVQHPTIAGPFLDSNTVVECNASTGFHYSNYKDPEKHVCHWPSATDDASRVVDLRFSHEGSDAVFSFVIDANDDLGWITAYAPTHNLLFGYIWAKDDYPWLNLWQSWHDGRIRYRGLEFGTTGIHQSFMEILEHQKLVVFRNRTYRFIDAGATDRRRYISFLEKVPPDFRKRPSFSLLNDQITITRSNGANPVIHIHPELRKYLVPQTPV